MRTLLAVLLLTNFAFAQEEAPTTVEGTNPLTWQDFQRTQQDILEQQKSILGTLFEIRESTRQLNINILSWQTAKQDVLKMIGDNRGCNIWQYKYDPRAEMAVLGFAVWGVFITGYLVLTKLGSVFKKEAK